MTPEQSEAFRRAINSVAKLIEREAAISREQIVRKWFLTRKEVEELFDDEPDDLA